MDQFELISVNEAWDLLQNKAQPAILLDIRDSQSFAKAHAKGAYHLQQANLTQICEALEFDQLIMVICYHGISSHAAAQFLYSYGFEKVYSVNGGFAAWQNADLPIDSENAQ